MTFRTMRRSVQQLSDEESRGILAGQTTGVLSVIGDDGYPYGVPVNYVYWNGKLYVHCAPEGHKLDAVLREPKVCFTLVAEDKVLEERYTTAYRSVILFGKAAIISDSAERRGALLALAKKYAPSRPEEEWKTQAENCQKALVIGIVPEHITGKQGKALLPKA